MTFIDELEALKNRLGWHRVREKALLTPAPLLVRELAKLLDCDLPADYCDFLDALGGVKLGDKVDRIAVEGIEPNPWKTFIPEVFYGFYSDRLYDIRKAVEMYGYRLPRYFVPLVADPGGNLAVYSAKGEYAGKIYFWDHEYSEFSTKHAMEDVYAELEEHGLETSRMDVAQAVLAWEKQHSAELAKPPGFGNMYLLASSLQDFVARVKEEPTAVLSRR